jgi:hypothetical protein
MSQIDGDHGAKHPVEIGSVVLRCLSSFARNGHLIPGESHPHARLPAIADMEIMHHGEQPRPDIGIAVKEMAPAERAGWAVLHKVFGKMRGSCESERISLERRQLRGDGFGRFLREDA